MQLKFFLLFFMGMLLSSFSTHTQSNSTLEKYLLKEIKLSSKTLENIEVYNKELPFPISNEIMQQFQTPLTNYPFPIYQFGKEQKEIIFYLGTFHGNERQGKYMVEQLIQIFSQNPQLYQDKSIFCVPVVNPIGYESNHRVNQHGIDLNRNFPTPNFIPHWKQGTSQYAGSTPLSEIESRTIFALLAPYTNLENRKKVKIVSIHSAAQMNNFDGIASLFLASEMSTFNHLPAKGYIGYPTPGSFGTLYGKVFKMAVVTLETRKVNPVMAWENNKEALLAVLNFPAYPTILESLK